jgi:hypothetical protein
MVARRKHFVARNVFGEGAKECRVTSRAGSDFYYRVDDRIFVPPNPTSAFDPYKIINFDKDENRKAAIYITTSTKPASIMWRRSNTLPMANW